MVDKPRCSYVKLSDGQVVYLPPGDSEADIDGTDQNGKNSKNVKIEKVHNVWGSSAGAGSDFFDIYRKHRYVEMDRQEKMERDWLKAYEGNLFQKTREKVIDSTLQRQKQRNKKRVSKKLRMRDKKKSKPNVDDGAVQESFGSERENISESLRVFHTSGNKIEEQEAAENRKDAIEYLPSNRLRNPMFKLDEEMKSSHELYSTALSLEEREPLTICPKQNIDAGAEGDLNVSMDCVNPAQQSLPKSIAFNVIIKDHDI